MVISKAERAGQPENIIAAVSPGTNRPEGSLAWTEEGLARGKVDDLDTWCPCRPTWFAQGRKCLHVSNEHEAVIGVRGSKPREILKDGRSLLRSEAGLIGLCSFEFTDDGIPVYSMRFNVNTGRALRLPRRIEIYDPETLSEVVLHKEGSDKPHVIVKISESGFDACQMR